MAFIPVPDTLAVEFRALWAGEKVENTVYFYSPDGWGLTATQLFLSIMEGWWRSEIAELVSADVEVYEIYGRDLTTQFGLAVSHIPATTLAGTISASPSQPNNVSCAISFRTALAGRSFRGRNYVLGLVESHVTNNTLTASIVTAYTAAYEELRLAAIDAGVDWVVVSRYSNNLPRVTGLSTTILSAGFVDATVDSQRRRLPGRGN